MSLHHFTKQFALATVACALLAGCASEDGSQASADATSGDTSAADSSSAGAGYTPFQQANLENQLVRVSGYNQIAVLRKSADFKAENFGESCAKWNIAGKSPTDATKIASLYVESAELSAKVKARKDAHDYNKNAPLGVDVDKAICDAIEAGAKAGAVERNKVGSIDWHAQFVDKGLQHFYYLSLYTYLVGGTRKGYDEGVGYYGRALDGSDGAKGISATVKSRDGNCGTTYTNDIWALLKTGRNQLDTALTAAGKSGNEDKLDAIPADLAATAAEIDKKLLQVFAISMGREMQGIQKGDKPEIKLSEGRGFFRILKPYLAEWDKQKGTKYATELAVGLEQDDPTKVEPQKVLDAIKAVWGLDVPALCTK